VPAPRDPRLRGLLGAQFVAAFNDNALRMVCLLLLLGPAPREQDQQAVTTRAMVAYNLPWVLLSLPAGVLADRISKRRVILGLRAGELVLMGVAAWALVDARPPLLLGLVVVTGVLTSASSPARYGLVPELVPASRLSLANGQLLLWTYVAYIAGQAAGGALLDMFRGGRGGIGLLLGGFSVLGFLCARAIPAVPAARTAGGLGETARRAWSAVRETRALRFALFGNLWYWSLAALLSQDLLVYAKSVLRVPDTGKGVLLAVLALGVGAGSLLAGLAARGRLGLRGVPLGAGGIAVVSAVVGLLQPGYALALPLLFLLGMAAGPFVVPIQSVIQDQAPPEDRGAVVAGMNLVIFLGIIAGSALASGLSQMGLSSPQILLVAAALAVLGAAVATVWVGALRRTEALE
jgi:acyl-[acyl-carrier-protein]-phospholipid O-acyltransferase/long-chain-fatty-acid--[acyl-carrier-protein] ligase